MEKDYDNEMRDFDGQCKANERNNRKEEIELCEALYLKDCYENKCTFLELQIEKLKNELACEKEIAARLEAVVSRPCKDCEYNRANGVSVDVPVLSLLFGDARVLFPDKKEMSQRELCSRLWRLTVAMESYIKTFDCAITNTRGVLVGIRGVV